MGVVGSITGIADIKIHKNLGEEPEVARPSRK
jgi:hypothetical protein